MEIFKKFGFNESKLVVMLVIAAIVAIVLIPMLDKSLVAPAWFEAYQIVSLKILLFGVFLGSVFTLIKAYKGKNWDFHKEIISEHNVAGAIVFGAIILGIALILGH
jgi:hypothetical protein